MMHWAEVTEATLKTVHHVMCNRIRKGYSAELLSCLIGKPCDYIDNAEFFRERSYPPSVVNKLIKLLGIPEEAEGGNTQDGAEMVRVGMEKSMIGGYNTYVCTAYLATVAITRFLVQEPASLAVKLESYVIGAYDLSVVVDAVYLMTRDGLFDQPMLAMDVLLYINDLLQMEVNPYGLMILLEEACDAVYDFKLIKVMRPGFFTYVKDQGYSGLC
ncbi:hypothetical protein ACSBL2_17085 [Pedobacter sp. AW31-3R]|uniref:hypothetical protein n=1 Tax=Pedobacter sp. AW31-3R TaxID=3445781 RepID=UPI003FA1865A